MAKPRIVFRESADGRAISYFHVERLEAVRIKKILALLPKLKERTDLQKLQRKIGSQRLPTESTLIKLAGAKKIDVLQNGSRVILATAPIIRITKEEYNPQNNRIKNSPPLRPKIWIYPSSH